MVNGFALCALAALSLLGLVACSDKSAETSALLENAKRNIASGDTVKARVDLQNALKLTPSDPSVNLALAKIEEQDGDLQSAVPHYLRAATIDAHLLEPQLRVADILVESGRYQDALGRISTIVGAFPNNSSALALRADLEIRQQQFGPAKADADVALKRDPGNTRALAVTAMLQLNDKDGEGALATIEKGLAQAPNDLRLLEVKAAALMTLNQPDKAVEAMRSIVRTSPRNAILQTVLANLEAENGHFDDALRNLSAAVDADPADEKMQLALANFVAGHGQAKDVLTNLEALIRRNPTTLTYDLALASYEQQRAETGEAVDVLSRAVQRLGDGPKGSDARIALGKAQFSSGQVDAAYRELSIVLRSDPQNENALLVMAVLKMQNGNAEAAISDLLTVVRNNPVSGRAFQLLGVAYADSGQPKLAVDAMKRAVAVTPGDDDAQIRLAVFFQESGSLDQSRDVMNRLTLRYPGSVQVWTTYAKLAIERKDWGTAGRALTHLKSLPSATALSALEGQLKAAQGDRTGAMVSYRSAIDSKVNVDAATIGAFARAALGDGKAEDAARYLTEATTSLSGEALASAWLSVMTLQADSGHLDKADSAFRQAVKAVPKSLPLYDAYVSILLAQKAYAKAQTAIAAGIEAGVPQGSLLILRGSVEEASGDLAAAEASYREALDTNPLSLNAANNYASILADRQPKNTEALTTARGRFAGLEENRSNPLVIDTIAWLDYRLGQFEEAKALLTRIDAGKSTNPQLRFHFAAVLIANGDKTGGLALLDTVRGLNFPGSAEVQALSAT